MTKDEILGTPSLKEGVFRGTEMKDTRTNVHSVRRMSWKPTGENLTRRAELGKVTEHSRNNKAWRVPIKSGNKGGTGEFGGEFQWSGEDRGSIAVEWR